MTLTEVLLLMMQKVGDELQTRTRVVKYAYFLGEITKRRDFGFRPHFYGPYSEDVVDSLGELVSTGLVEETRLTMGADSHGFERCRYKYHLTEAGNRVATILRVAANAREVQKLDDASARLHQAASRMNYMSVSCAAKAHYLLKRTHRVMTAADIRKEAQLFGWHLDTADIASCANLLTELQLAKQAPAGNAQQR